MTMSETSIGDTVDALLDLQEIDREIREREEALEELEPEVREAEARVRELRQALKEARAELEEAEEKRRSDDRSIDAGRETLKRLKKRAEDVQNMRQHKAVREELQSARRNLEEAEEEALESMQWVEDAENRVEELEEEHGEALEEHDRRGNEVEQRRRDLEEELERGQRARRRRTDRIDDDIVSMYEEVRRGTTADVLAPLNGDHCGHCFTMVPPQRRNEIRAGETLYRCEGCGVILHAPGVGEDGDD